MPASGRPGPPAPGPHAGPLDLVGGRVWVRGCGSALLWWLGSRGPRTCPCPMGRVSGGTCGMSVHGRCIVGSILRTIPPPSTAIPQMPPVLPNYIILEKKLRDALDLIDRTCYTSLDGMYLVEQTDLGEQTGYVDRTG